ncbi:MAG: hypothetical protein ACRC8Q_05970, partial [Aeromonas sp.]
MTKAQGTGRSRTQRYKDEQRAIGNRQLSVWATPAALEQWARIKSMSRGKSTDQTVLSNIAKIIGTMD